MNKYRIIIEELKDCRSLETLSDNRIVSLYKCIRSYDPLVRFDAAVILGRFEQNETTIRLLKQLIWDKDQIVASEACEALRAIGDESCIEPLIKRLNARSAIVRGYAVMAAADLCTVYEQNAERVKHILLYRMKHEKDPWVMQDYHCAMYLLGEKDHLAHLTKGLVSKDYLIRASTVSLIKDFVFDDEQRMAMVSAYALKHMDKNTREYDELMKLL